MCTCVKKQESELPTKPRTYSHSFYSRIPSLLLPQLKHESFVNTSNAEIAYLNDYSLLDNRSASVLLDKPTQLKDDEISISVFVTDETTKDETSNDTSVLLSATVDDKAALNAYDNQVFWEALKLLMLLTNLYL